MRERVMTEAQRKWMEIVGIGLVVLIVLGFFVATVINTLTGQG